MADVTSPLTAARPPISFGAWLGVVLLFLFFGIFVLVLVAATPHGNTYEEKRAKAREEKLKTIRDTASKDLNSYAWVDKGKGVARIPIDRAMQLTLRDLASKKPEPANPIAAPAEAAAPAASPPAPAVSPEPSVSGTPKPTSVAGPSSENRGQPAAAANPPSASPGTQPGPSATPAASAPPSGQPAGSPMPEQKPSGTPAPEKSPA
ncbi:MAG: hypothetical protein DME45_11600 [Verrucomicrobia bacterium]|nr:MAG: hypothetical protein DME45_11600 [Verrucomicrobiota bacterium]